MDFCKCLEKTKPNNMPVDKHIPSLLSLITVPVHNHLVVHWYVRFKMSISVNRRMFMVEANVDNYS
jgi:hypothetical protein